MKRKRFAEEQIIAVLREHEAGAKAGDLARKHGVSEATLYNWKSRFGGMDMSEAKRLKGLPMQNGYVESFNGRMRDELLNESLFFGLGHARSAIVQWVEDFNTTRPHSSLGYQTPAAFAGLLAATGNPVAQPAPHDVTETVEALIAAG